MTAEVLIDGYNLLMTRFPRAIRGSSNRLERARKHLLDWLVNRLDEGIIATVAFDARGPERSRREPTRQRVNGIEVVFATGVRSADELIFSLCRQHPAPSRLTVVSNDREIQRGAKKCRAHWLSCEEFEAQLTAPQNSKPVQTNSAPAEKPGAPSADEVASYSAIFHVGDLADNRPRRALAKVKAPHLETTTARHELTVNAQHAQSPLSKPTAKNVAPIDDPKPEIANLELDLEGFLSAMLDGVKNADSEPLDVRRRKRNR